MKNLTKTVLRQLKTDYDFEYANELAQALAVFYYSCNPLQKDIIQDIFLKHVPLEQK